MYRRQNTQDLIEQIGQLPQPPTEGGSVRIPLDLLHVWLRHHKITVTGTQFFTKDPTELPALVVEPIIEEEGD